MSATAPDRKLLAAIVAYLRVTAGAAVDSESVEVACQCIEYVFLFLLASSGLCLT
jgi:hypothetical protein